MSNSIFEIVAFSILIESLITYYKEFFAGGNASWEIVVSLLLGMIVAISYNLDLPAHFNLNSKIPYIGCILTGILISRSSNYVFDIIKKLTDVNQI